MGAIRYISDLHFGHENVIRFDNRPFETIEEMNRALIENWQRVVAKDDTIYILGDFCWGKEDMWLGIAPQLPGNKVLIRGNHDLKGMSKALRRHFQDVTDYKVIVDGGRHVVMSHYPMMMYRGASHSGFYMLCGHVHTTQENTWLEKWREEIRRSHTQGTPSFGNIVNVGCMMPYMEYRPKTLDEILTALGWPILKIPEEGRNSCEADGAAEQTE